MDKENVVVIEEEYQEDEKGEEDEKNKLHSSVSLEEVPLPTNDLVACTVVSAKIVEGDSVPSGSTAATLEAFGKDERLVLVLHSYHHMR